MNNESGGKREESAMGPILNSPVILDLGKTKRKNIKQLRQGRGKLLGDIEDAMKEISASLGTQADGKQLVPVVLVYRKKAKRSKGGGLFPIFS
jgi:hypothetical protein